jgi:hypothetical protein
VMYCSWSCSIGLSVDDLACAYYKALLVSPFVIIKCDR